MKKEEESNKLRKSGEGKLNGSKGAPVEPVKKTKHKTVSRGPSVTEPAAVGRKAISENEPEEDNSVAQEVTQTVEKTVAPHSTRSTKYSDRKHEHGKPKEGYAKKLHSGRSMSEHHRMKVKTSELSEGSNAVSRQLQKRNTQKQMMKKGKNHATRLGNKTTKSISQKAEETGRKIARALVMFVHHNPLLLTLLGLSFFSILIVAGAASSVGLMLSGSGDATAASTFTASDQTILNVEEEYKRLERELQEKVDSVERNYPGFDEYYYSLVAIEHDPVALAACLTIMFEDYSEGQAKEVLPRIFNGQYELTIEPKTEIRTRIETHWHYVTKYREEQRIGFRWEGIRLVLYTYTVQVPYEEMESYEEEVEYEYRVLYVTLTGRSIDAYVAEDAEFTDDQILRYQLLIKTKGNKPELFEDL